MNRGVKISIIGAGRVGSTTAHTIAVQGLASEIVLVDIFKEKAQGEALDISQGTVLLETCTNVRAGDYPDTFDSDIIIFTLGAARKPGQSRIDLAKGNVEIIEQAIPEIVRYSPDAKYVIVSNPVDIVTYTIIKLSGIPENQIIGTGCLLDTARLREEVSSYAHMSPKNIHLQVLGEHGATAMIPWSLASVYGIKFDEFVSQHPEMKMPDHKALLDDVHSAGGRVIKLKGATFNAVAIITAYVCSCILHDAKAVMPLSTMMHGQFGLENVCVSIPCVLGARGIERVNTPRMTEEEVKEFTASANSLQEVIKGLNI